MAGPDQLARLLEELQKEGITDPGVLSAIARVPRQLFVPAESRDHAFRNIPLPIGEGQTISQPFVVGLMSQSLGLTGIEKVLEVGTGSGYQCAILAELCSRVVSVERLANLAVSARSRLATLGYTNVEVVVGDGSLGHPALAPYDAIVVTAASPAVPEPLLDQLAEGGRLVLPVGPHLAQQLYLYVKRGGEVVSRALGSVRFVPLIGEAAWRDDDAGSLRDPW